MSNEIKNQCGVVVFIALVVLSMENLVGGKPMVPCYFIFGDSLVDSGNNNELQTSAKVHYGPYGIDFPKGPTGRFTNGQTVVDIIAKRLGFEDYIPPFATANRSEILRGVNYATGSAGIRDESGQDQGVCISLSKQLANHQTTVSRIVEILGSNKNAVEHLNQCLYSFVIGSNDYINNYFMPDFYNTSQLYTTEEYAKVLVGQYSNQIRTLYKQGARKMNMVGLGPIGCTPNATLYYGTNGSLCVDKMNMAVTLFNKHLRSAVERLNMEFIDAKFVYTDTIQMTSEYFYSSPPPPTAASLQIVRGCCEVGDNGLCIPDKPPCQDRHISIFWDSFHPTEAANKLLVNEILTSLDRSELYPINLLELAQLPIKKQKSL